MRLLCCSVLLLVLVATAAASSSTAPISCPLFAWSSHTSLANRPDGQPHTQSLQIHSSLHDALEQVLKGLTAGAGAAVQQFEQHSPDVVLAVLGDQLRSSHLKTRAMHATLQPLKVMLDTSASSLTAPYILHQAGTKQDQVSKLQSLAAGMDLKTSVVGCLTGSGSSLEEVLAEHTHSPHMVVLCTQPPSPSASGSPQAVAAELLQVQEAHDRLAQLGKRHVTIYAAVPDGAGAVPTHRQLQSVQADVGTCGQLCQTQVKWLEGILAALLLAIAAFSGMCCLYMLDTPTRFEKPKEGARND